MRFTKHRETANDAVTFYLYLCADITDNKMCIERRYVVSILFSVHHVCLFVILYVRLNQQSSLNLYVLLTACFVFIVRT